MIQAMYLLNCLLLLGGAWNADLAGKQMADNHGSPECQRGQIRLAGLTSPAVISESMFIHAEDMPPDSVVSFYIDGRFADRQDDSPYWLGGINGAGEPNGFRVEPLGFGKHQVRATAMVRGRKTCSDVVEIEVIRSNNASFSDSLTPYQHQLFSLESNGSKASQTAATTIGISGQSATRRSIAAMYGNWGFDLFLDYGSDRSAILRNLSPKNWAPPRVEPGLPWSMRFSPDAVFYHRIPQQWPRIPLPARYFRNVQLNTAHGGDGIGFAEVIANPQSSHLIIRSQWYNVQSTRVEIPFRIPFDWSKELPTTEAGDRHVIFIDPAKMSFVSAYKTSASPRSGTPSALYAAGPTPFNSMGDSGGSIAANFAELPLLIQPGESTDPLHPIRHAIGGPVRRVWAARVYPATAWDAGIITAKDTCSGQGQMNTGLIPYGGVIQLDPKLDLEKLSLSLPARRILEAMQTYGYYVMDYGCADLDIYTALDSAELEPYGGLWGSDRGPGVQNEIQRILTTSTLYVVAPLVKKQ